ncbi:uncharacterized protein [Triticum aestivum]|uniref:uncharacterized protein n=1 Tax=Triticum aestivum TaxID=4565 RepID=UPI001D023E00|nr:uncharacterized protein LOC123069237 [Triticum aestivum]
MLLLQSLGQRTAGTSRHRSRAWSLSSSQELEARLRSTGFQLQPPLGILHRLLLLLSSDGCSKPFLLVLASATDHEAEEVRHKVYETSELLYATARSEEEQMNHKKLKFELCCWKWISQWQKQQRGHKEAEEVFQRYTS